MESADDDVLSRLKRQKEKIGGASVKDDKRGNARRVARDKALAAVGINWKEPEALPDCSPEHRLSKFDCLNVPGKGNCYRTRFSDHGRGIR